MKRKRILFVGIIVVLIALVAMGIFGCQRNPISVPMKEEANSIQTEKETSTETSDLSSCVIFDEEYCKYCKEGELLTGDKFSEIGFNLPAGTKIYSPFDGILDISYYTDTSKGIGVTIWPLKEVMHTFWFEGIIPNPSIEGEVKQYKDRGLLKLRSEKEIGIIMTEGGPEIPFYKVEKGEFIGEVSDTYPLPMMLIENNVYNLVIAIYSDRNLPPYSPKDSSEDSSQLYVDMDFIKQCFPGVEEKMEKPQNLNSFLASEEILKDYFAIYGTVKEIDGSDLIIREQQGFYLVVPVNKEAKIFTEYILPEGASEEEIWRPIWTGDKEIKTGREETNFEEIRVEDDVFIALDLNPDYTIKEMEISILLKDLGL